MIVLWGWVVACLGYASLSRACVPKDRLHSIIHQNDENGDGSLDWDEFLAIMRRGVMDPDEKYIFDLFFDNSAR